SIQALRSVKSANGGLMLTFINCLHAQKKNVSSFLMVYFLGKSTWLLAVSQSIVVML
ncbi:hypothetical protein ACJX0J_026637, partial [Zea mays]